MELDEATNEIFLNSKWEFESAIKQSREAAVSIAGTSLAQDLKGGQLHQKTLSGSKQQSATLQERALQVRLPSIRVRLHPDTENQAWPCKPN